MITEAVDALASWQTFVLALLIFGLLPGPSTFLVTLIYPRGHPRRRELRAELYKVPRLEQPFWVAEQVWVAVVERERLFTERRRTRREHRYRLSVYFVSGRTLYTMHSKESAEIPTSEPRAFEMRPVGRLRALYIRRFRSGSVLVEAGQGRSSEPEGT